MPELEPPSAGRPWSRWLPTIAVIASLAVALAVGVFVASDRDKPGNVQAASVITEVRWQQAVIDLPKNSDMPCPTGRQHMRPVKGGGVLASFAWAPAGDSSQKLILNSREIAYGDLTGDGEPEAILNILCSNLPATALRNGLRGGQLLVVTMRADHSLKGLGYAGQAYADYPSFRVENQKLMAQVWYGRIDPIGAAYAVYAPAHSRTYQWNGTRFAQAAGRTSPLLLRSMERSVGSPVRLATIMRDGASVCPGRTARFDERGLQTDGVMYKVTSNIRPTDFDHDGNQELLAQVRCTGNRGTFDSLYLFGQGVDEFVVLDVPIANGGQYVIQDGWQVKGNALTVNVTLLATGETGAYSIVWNGKKFENGLGAYQEA
ncbi:hypothetical protein NCC78_09550 [Micromonospora phytophila]|uniref:hypothetical protein n=1 Tax=Micromonospora phytophila TaxID=709888 RepID=UPI00202DF668|nr:hypothetical protein [Micromonospora phytophila]MCM0674933.1 hypothetical protein [Micromonospora phytophila]